MKTHLLIAIRYVRRREAEARRQQGASSWLLRNVPIWARYHYLTILPLGGKRLSGFYVPSNGVPTSKGEITRTELRSANVPAEQIQPRIRTDNWPRLRKAARLLARLPSSIIIGTRLSRRAKRSKEDIGIVLATLVFKRMLAGNQNLIPIVNSDLSPSQVMVACAAQALRRPCIWWQDDYHYSEPVPFSAAGGVILSRNGLQALTARNPNALVLQRIRSLGSAGPKEVVQPTGPVECVGVAVNGMFSASDDELAALTEIRDTMDASNVELRLHPTSSLERIPLPKGVKLAPLDESVEEFVQRMNIVFSGNSAIQYKMVLAGTPVIHIPQLDPLQYDLYQYVERNLVFGCKRMTKATVNDCFDFYGSSNFRKSIKQEYQSQFKFDALPLTEIKRFIPGNVT